MGKNQEGNKTPVIVVKKRRSFSPPLSEKTDVISHSDTGQIPESVSAPVSSPVAETHIPEAPVRKKNKKTHRFPRPPHWTREFTHDCVEKVKRLFPHLRAEGGGFLPLKIGITSDIAAFLAEHPETELTLDEWSCAVHHITSRRVYLQRASVVGVPRYALNGLPVGHVSERDAQNSRRWLAWIESVQQRSVQHDAGEQPETSSS